MDEVHGIYSGGVVSETDAVWKESFLITNCGIKTTHLGSGP
jgi:hypothetical protein